MPFAVLAVFLLLAWPSGLLAWAASPAKVKLCHVPPDDPLSFHTITVSEKALDAHLAHGDVVGDCSGGFCSQATVPQTGQTTSYGPRDDGELERGVAQPNPRFTDNGNGTVTDNLTNLIWLKDADCFGHRVWANALAATNSLASGSCGLTNGSVAGDWRLPNVRELESLVHYGYFDRSLPNTAGTGQWVEGDPFLAVQSDRAYWSSTTYANNASIAWVVGMGDGSATFDPKFFSYRVWPVSGGQ